VTIRKQGDKFILNREGSAYFIRGAVGMEYLPKLAGAGANSVRIWNDYGKNLLLADSLGLSALVSLPVKSERDGLNYDDEIPVRQQREDILKIVRLNQLKHSVLIWAIGNELDYIPGTKPYNLSVWNAVNDIAKQIKLIDPDHPVMTVIGTSMFEKVKDIVARCPDLDLLGVNAYGDMEQIPSLLQKFGWDRPYVYTEWGVSGYWEVPKTEWNAPFEENSSAKAELYDRKYRSVVLSDSNSCLGSYVFFWGARQETTPTWFNLLDYKGNISEAVNIMQLHWTNKVVAEHAPRIDSILLAGKKYFSNVYLVSGSIDSAAVYVTEPEEEPMNIQWEIRPEAKYSSYAGQGESTPEIVPGSIMENNKKQIAFRSPASKGAFRIYVFIYDGKGHFATANFPFYVK
jgi:hypothetical protein